ncbi:MAG: hypothetical protein J0L92_15750 [Deltaproteobacteria bacterium]|nr:hypothetical protein [Deltaproteobacteria bacterium]
MHHARVALSALSHLALVPLVVLDAEPARADAPAASEARALAAPHALDDAPAPPVAPEVFEGPIGLELSLGLGSASSLSLGLVVAPELAIDLALEGFLAQLDGVTLAALTIGVVFEVSFTRPYVGEVTPIAELLFGAAVPAIVPAGWQAYPRAFGSLGLGVGYVLDPSLALRALVGPTLALDEFTLVVGITGHLAVVARV